MVCLYIYIYKEECLSVCLSVRYAFSPCNSYRHQTFHGTPLGPEEGREEVGAVQGEGGRLGWNFTQLMRTENSIYIYEEQCLSVRYAFSPCNSYDHQTFHDASLGPREGRWGVGLVIGG